jgi:hypothetical protein
MLYCYDLYKYKYILHIDGFVAAWRMSFEMFSMSVILKVDSPWVEHFYKYLKPWVHYIPIKSDLSNLISTIEWCRENDDLCYTIAMNAFQFAYDNFTKDNLFNYIQSIIYDKPEAIFLDNSLLIDIPNIESRNKEPEVDINFDNVKYTTYKLSNYNYIINKKIKTSGIIDKITNSYGYNKFKNRLNNRTKNLKQLSKACDKFNYEIKKYDNLYGFSDDSYNEELSYCFGNIDFNFFKTNNKITDYIYTFSKYMINLYFNRNIKNKSNLFFLLFLKNTNLIFNNHLRQYKKGSYEFFDCLSKIEIADDDCEILIANIGVSWDSLRTLQ